MARPLFVETFIRTDLDRIWSHTQSPPLHEQWDLRFSAIRPLPPSAECDSLHFRYETRIGFGLVINGWGEAVATAQQPDGTRSSMLRFGSDHPLSLIRSGGGYWRYTPVPGGIRFETRYDYATRFGPTGRLLDRLFFRPMMAWATAWSFDRLRLWLEDGVSPTQSLRHAQLRSVLTGLLVFIWLFHAIVPKLLYPGAGEFALLQATGLFPGHEQAILRIMALGEVALGLGLLRWGRSSVFLTLQLALLAMLTIAGLVAHPAGIAAPFNPLTFGLALSGLLIGLLLLGPAPRAGRCRYGIACNKEANSR